MSNTDPLTALAGIISQSVQNLQGAYSAKGLSFPSLDEPSVPTPFDEDFELGNTRRLIIAAAYQIIATVRTPMETVLDYAPGMQTTAALGVVDETDVPDLLKGAGPQGLHVNDIGAKIGIDPDYIRRVLRYLATRHVFREVSPDVYANNRISFGLAKTKSFEELKKDKNTKYDGSTPAAFTGHVSDESFKSIANLYSFFKDAPSSVAAPFNLFSGEEAPLWKWYQKPDNVWRLHRFAAAMKGQDGLPSAPFTELLDWKSIPRDSVVVDVGGSVGKVTYELFKAFPHLKYVIQDVPLVVDDAKTFWKGVAPKDLEDGRVLLQEQDFFEPQTIKDSAVFVLRFILHDWPDASCVKILKNLRAAATLATRLVVLDAIMPHVCHVPGGPPPPPAPLLGNLGAGLGGTLTMLDIQMLTLFGGKERTLDQFVALGDATGWKLEKVMQGMPCAIAFRAV